MDVDIKLIGNHEILFDSTFFKGIIKPGDIIRCDKAIFENELQANFVLAETTKKEKKTNDKIEV